MGKENESSVQIIIFYFGHRGTLLAGTLKSIQFIRQFIVHPTFELVGSIKDFLLNGMHLSQNKFTCLV